MIILSCSADRPTRWRVVDTANWQVANYRWENVFQESREPLWWSGKAIRVSLPVSHRYNGQAATQ
jgi:hypothetical protein